MLGTKVNNRRVNHYSYFRIMENKKNYTQREEKANYLTHALGLFIAVIATVFLLQRALAADNLWAVAAYAIFGFGMVICMLSSTIYHYVQEPKLKALLRHFDHGNIYVLIAATYSPFTLILLRNEGLWGWGLFGFVWLVAIVGISFSFQKLKANNHIATASYVLMGMVILLAIQPLITVCVENNCLDALYWMAAGGVFYLIGSVFYALAKHEFIHTVFHLFVLLGLGCHIVSAFLIPVTMQ